MRSSAANALQDITGYLSYRDGRFTQYLEGEESAVLGLLDRIEHDFRHEFLTIAHLGETKRNFPDWSLKILNPLWYLTGGPVDAIDELLTLTAGSTDSDAITRETLTGLVAQISSGAQ